MMGSFWVWGWWFFLTLPDRLSCPLFIYVVHFEVEFTILIRILNHFLWERILAVNNPIPMGCMSSDFNFPRVSTKALAGGEST